MPGVNIALLGEIGSAGPVKWDNASIPCAALHRQLMPPSTPLHSVSHTVGTALNASGGFFPTSPNCTLHSAALLGCMQRQCISEFRLHSRFYHGQVMQGVNLNTNTVSECSTFYKPALTLGQSCADTQVSTYPMSHISTLPNREK